MYTLFPPNRRRRLARTVQRVTCICAAALTAPQPASADTELAYLDEFPVVLSATRLKQSRHETPTSVTVIDRQMIEASGARNMVDLLRLVPGMQTAYSTGNQQVVTYHGLSDEFSRRLQVLVDGRSVYLPSWGGISWNSIPLILEDIERIEVIRGPNSASYGSNSFLGIISITTRHAAEDRGTYAKLTRGNDDIGEAIARFGGHNGRLDYRVTASYQQDDGFSGATYRGNRPWDNNDWYRVRRLSTRLDYQASLTDSWMLQLGTSKSPQGEGWLLTDRLENPPRVETEYGNFLQLRWERNTGRHDFHVQFHRDEHKTEEIADSTSITSLDAAQALDLFNVPVAGILTSTYSANADMRTQRYDLEFQHRYTPDDTTRWVWGSSLRTDRARAAGWFGTEDWQYNHWFRLFGDVQHHLTDRLQVNAGAMMENNTFIGNDLSPRLAVNYHLNAQHTVRAAISKASRTPSMIEERADGTVYGTATYETAFGTITQDFALPILLASGGQGRERITSSEIGYFGELADRQLQVDVKLFYDEADALLTSVDNDAGLGDWKITDSARMQGIETQIDWRPRTHTLVRFGHSYIDIDSDNNEERYATSAPRNSFVLFGSHRFPRQIDASFAYHYSSEVNWLQWNPLDSIERLDVRLAKGFTVDGYDGSIALVGQNLTGTHQEFRRGNKFDQRAFVQLSLRSR